MQVAQSAIAKNQVYLVNYGMDHTILEGLGYSTEDLPFEKEISDFVENSPLLEASYPLYCFNVGRFLNNDPEDPSSLNCTIEIVSANKTETITIPKDRLANNIFSYYPEDIIENACDVYCEDSFGIILNYQIAKLLGIQNNDQVSLKLTVYVPVAMKNTTGSITISSMTHDHEIADITYLPVEMTLPVKGILTRAHIDIAECFGYLNYQTMATI